MGLEILIPPIVTLITAILKMLIEKVDVKAPNAAYPLSTPLTGMALAPLAGVDMGLGAVLGMAGSMVYESAKSLLKTAAPRAGGR